MQKELGCENSHKRFQIRQHSVKKANQTHQATYKTDDSLQDCEMRGGGERGKTKREWKPCRTVPWHLSLGCCLFWTAQRQIVLLVGDYWPLGHYHLNFPWCIPANREQGIKLNYNKQEHAERRKKEKKKGWWSCSRWCRRHFIPGRTCSETDCLALTSSKQWQAKVIYNRQLVVPSISKGNV